MLFCSQVFLLFFTVVFIVYWSTPWHEVRVWLLLAASLFFYCSWNTWLAGIIAVSTILDYVLARCMAGSGGPWRKRLCLLGSLVMNLGVLVYFKYANFFLQSLQGALQAVGASASLPVLQVILPIGISFYTFEAINYTVDVYRGRVPAERNLGHFMLFITFFPHLVAGPIVRARDFLPQIKRPKRKSWLRFHLGMQLFLLGLVKKLVIADRMALFVDPVFQNPQAYSTGTLWLAVLAYALQIYCDFSGYTDMALGSAHLLGYKLAINFRLPYLARNSAEFWHRWHISLSTWLRDYLFIPLGGSRGTALRTSRNLLITMTLGGLWHGANWTFVLWGVVHGLLLIGHRVFRAWCGSKPRLEAALESVPGTGLRIAVTFLSVALCWVLFRAVSLAAAGAFLQRLLWPRGGLPGPLAVHVLATIGVLVALSHVLVSSGAWRKLAVRLPAPLLGWSYAVLLNLTLLLSADSTKAFIYFQF
jgi:alginate O-acetyltransferase complex protein AlgI